MQSRSPITTQRRWWDFLQPSLDAAAVMASLAIVSWTTGRAVNDVTMAMGLISVVVFLLLSQLTGLHRRFDANTVNREMTNIAATWTLTVFALAVLGFVTRYSETFARSVILIWFVLAPALVGLGRMCLRIIQRGLLQRGIGTRRVAIAGLNDLGRQTFANIADEPSLGLRVIGFFDDREAHRAEAEQQEILEGDLNDLVAAAQRGEVDTVLITLPMRAEDRIQVFVGPAEQFDRLGLHRPRLLCLRTAAFAVDQHGWIAGSQRFRESVVRRRWRCQASRRPDASCPGTDCGGHPDDH